MTGICSPATFRGLVAKGWLLPDGTVTEEGQRHIGAVNPEALGAPEGANAVVHSLYGRVLTREEEQQLSAKAAAMRVQKLAETAEEYRVVVLGIIDERIAELERETAACRKRELAGPMDPPPDMRETRLLEARAEEIRRLRRTLRLE